MKHRSVIAFVIVAAALFAAPQLSHDLQNLRNGIGARLRGELLQAFLSLHPEDGAAVAAPAARGAQTLLATCTKGGAPAAKAKKDEARAAAEPQSDETAAGGPAVELAMIIPPGAGPDGAHVAQTVRAEIDPIGEAVAARGEIATEVAMIIPPDAGIDPPALKAMRADVAKARGGAALKRREADELRSTFVATHFQGREWPAPTGEALRMLRETLPGNFEFRLDSNGSKAKTLKVIKRAFEAGRPSAAAPAPRASRLPAAVACDAPTAGSQDLTAGE